MSSDIRDRMIATVAKGNTFVDVGGLFEITKERISLARQHGATEVTLMDVEPMTCQWWEEMRSHLASKGVNDCVYLSQRVESSHFSAFDVVYSSGVLYHCSDPLSYLASLRRISRKYVIVASTILPSNIPSDAGDLTFIPGSVLYLPGVQNELRAWIEAFYAMHARPNLFSGASTATVGDWYPNWWLPTTEAFASMCVNAQFRVLEEGYIDPVGYSLLLEPTR